MRIVHGLLALGIAISVSGCMSAGWQPPGGFVYNNSSGINPATVVEASDGTRASSKTGTACAMGVLGMFGWGDMSLKAAKADGGITRVDALDYAATDILLGLYSKHCTTVSGQ